MVPARRKAAGALEVLPVGASEKPSKHVSIRRIRCKITDCFLGHRLVLF